MQRRHLCVFRRKHCACGCTDCCTVIAVHIPMVCRHLRLLVGRECWQNLPFATTASLTAACLNRLSLAVLSSPMPCALNLVTVVQSCLCRVLLWHCGMRGDLMCERLKLVSGTKARWCRYPCRERAAQHCIRAVFATDSTVCHLGAFAGVSCVLSPSDELQTSEHVLCKTAGLQIGSALVTLGPWSVPSRKQSTVTAHLMPTSHMTCSGPVQVEAVTQGWVASTDWKTQCAKLFRAGPLV